MHLRNVFLLFSSAASLAHTAPSPAAEVQSLTLQADIALNSDFNPAKDAQEPILHPTAHTGRMTYFAPGLGSCGRTSKPTDHIVALSSAIQGVPPKHCGQTIRITHAGKHVDATVVDSCPGCGPDDIDVSPAVFKVFSGLGTGVVQVSWEYVGKKSGGGVGGWVGEGREGEEGEEGEWEWMYEA